MLFTDNSWLNSIFLQSPPFLMGVPLFVCTIHGESRFGTCLLWNLEFSISSHPHIWPGGMSGLYLPRKGKTIIKELLSCSKHMHSKRCWLSRSREGEGGVKFTGLLFLLMIFGSSFILPLIHKTLSSDWPVKALPSPFIGILVSGLYCYKSVYKRNKGLQDCYL